MPNYTKIPNWFRKEYKEKINKQLSNEDIVKLSEQDPVIFAKYYLGQTMRLHQAYMIYRILKAKPKTKDLGFRIAMCIARQLGKSIGFICFCVWACWYNKYPATMFKHTIIYVTSRDDTAAEDLIKKMKGVLKSGDKNMEKFGEVEYFLGSLKKPTNSHEITFLNDAYIGSFPPTLTTLGKSASLFFIDEAHRLNCTDTDTETFFDNATSIVAETKGGIVLSSSPEGQSGFFYDAIDPNKENKDNEYDAIWWSHEIWDDGTPECLAHKALVESEKKRLTKAGRFKMWQQEHMAMFTVTQLSFFENEDIDSNIEDTSEYYEWHKSHCSVGYDYGMTNSRTVVTVRTKYKGKIMQLFQFRGEAGFDNNNLRDPNWEHSIQNLNKRYDLSVGVYADDCPNGDDNNKWIKNKMPEIPIHLYNFRSDQMSKTDGVNRNCAAYSYRSALKRGELKIPQWNKIQVTEMKTVNEDVKQVLISIKSPKGQLCDTFDSDMMACIPFLDMQSNYDFEVDSLEVEQPKEDYKAFDDGFRNISDEEMKEIMADKDYDRLVF